MKIRFTKKGFRLSSTRPGDGEKILRFVEQLATPLRPKTATTGTPGATTTTETTKGTK